MHQVIFATSNPIKFQLGKDICTKFGITLKQDFLDVPEIQGEDGELVARDKAEKVFAHFQKPVITSDESWLIPGLKNFPGPYMRSMNDWFTPEDWLRLTSTLADRRIILRQFAAYQDAAIQKLFCVDIEGVLLHEIRGKSPYPHSTITSFDGGKHSNAEFHERGETSANHRQTAWHQLAPWLKERLA